MATPLSLFDDDSIISPQTASLVHRPISVGSGKKAGTVNRLLAQVQTLRLAMKRERARLDQALIFHAAQIRPRQDRAAALRTAVVHALARFLDDRRLGAPGKRRLRDIVIEQIDALLVHVATPEPDITALFERLHGVDFADVVQGSIDEARSEMAEFFAAIGLDGQVPELRSDMSEEEVAATAAEMADRMRQLYEAQLESGRVRGKKRTKRELREESRAERFERARKISIGAIYKRLVKALHPDLELDAAVRERKSALMQQVTAAYAGNDLHTLLRLEFECLDGGVADAVSRTDETLSAYVDLLRQQSAQLRAEIADLPFHPRYRELLTDGPFGMLHTMDGPAEARRLDAAIEGLQAGLERLTDEQHGLLEVRELIQMRKRERGRGPSRR